MKKKFNLSDQALREYGPHHRSGWSFVVNALCQLHSNEGIRLETFLEKKFVFGSEEGDAHNHFKPYDEPWIGIAHVPNNIPFFMDTSYTPEHYKESDFWTSSFKNCAGLLTTSGYLAKDLERIFNVEVDSFLHPTSLDCVLFSFEKYKALATKKIVQVGAYGRKTTSIFRMELNPKKYKKVIVGIRNPNDFIMLLTESYLYDIPLESRHVEILGYLANDDYDELISESLVLVDLHDASANNAIIECIARATPIITKRHAASIDYLGENYPLFFDHIDEVSDDFVDIDRIWMAHQYLLKRKHFVSSEYFIDSVVNSRIYQKI